MALTNLSQITTSGISTLADINLNNITGVAATFTGNVTVGGTLTYDDVTNIDSVGLVTARSGVNITGGDLTLPDAIIHAGDTNTKIRFPAADTFTVETGGAERLRITSAGLVGIGTDTPGDNLEIKTDAHGEGLTVKSTGSTSNAVTFDANRSGGDQSISNVYGRWNGTTVAQMGFVTGVDATNKNDGYIYFGTESDASNGNVNATERLRITSTGKLEAYKGTSTTGKTSGSEAFTVGNGAGNHRFAVYPDGTTVIGGTGLIGNYNILLQNDGVGVFDNQLLIGLTTGVGVGGVPADLNSTEVGRGFINISRDDTAAADHILFGKNGSIAASMGTDTTNTLVFKTGTTERLRITSAGKLSVTGNTANMEYLRMGGNNDRGLRFTSSSGSSSVGVVHTINAPGDSGNQGAIVLQTNSSERLRITSDGKVGIGTNNPASLLHLSHTNGALVINRDLDAVNQISFRTLNAHRGSIGANSAACFTVYDSSSAERLRITSAGLVGIGTNNPGGILHAHAPNSGLSNIRLSGTASNQVEYDIRQGIVGVNNAGFSIRDLTNSATRLAITSDGQLIHGGVSNPADYDLVTGGSGYRSILLGSTNGATAALIIDGAANGDGSGSDYASIEHNTNGEMRYKNRQSSGSGGAGHVFYTTNADTERLRITSTGLVGINDSSPGRALSIKYNDNTAYSTAAYTPAGGVIKIFNESTTAGCTAGEILFGARNSGTGYASITGISPGSQEVELAFRVMDGATFNEAIRINKSGNIGIGINNPTLTAGTGVHIAGGNAALKLQNTNNGDWAFIEYADESNTTKYIQGYRDSSGMYAIRPGTSLNATPGITLDSNGNVGIHETNPARQLSVYHASNSGVEIKSGTAGQSSIFFTDTADGNIGMIGYYHSDDSMFLRTNNATRVTIDSGGEVGINVTSPSDRLHVKGAILQQGYSDGATVRSIVMTASFGAGTHDIFTCTATGVDNTAVATMEYVSLYAYSGTNHYAGIKLASTRRSGNNSGWTNLPNVNVAGSGNDSNIQPNLFFQNGVLMVTIPSSTQVTATVRITVRAFTLVRNYSAG